MSNNDEKQIGGVIFKKYEEFWLSTILFNKEESTFEIYNEILNEDIIEKIISNLENKILCIHNDSESLLKVLSNVFWGHDRNNYFTFSGFVIDKTTINLSIDFRMSYHCSGEDNFSDYANWYIDIKDFKLLVAVDVNYKICRFILHCF